WRTAALQSRSTSKPLNYPNKSVRPHLSQRLRARTPAARLAQTSPRPRAHRQPPPNHPAHVELAPAFHHQFRSQRSNMATLTDREKRSVRMAAIAIAIYLVLFFGLRLWKSLEAARLDYQVMLMDAQRLRRELRPYENRVLLAQKLKENFHIEPHKLSRSTVVAEASAAIQKAASSGGVQLGP